MMEQCYFTIKIPRILNAHLKNRTIRIAMRVVRGAFYISLHTSIRGKKYPIRNRIFLPQTIHNLDFIPDNSSLKGETLLRSRAVPVYKPITFCH